MSSDGKALSETVTLSQAAAILRAMAHEQSVLLLSPPGVGKSDTVAKTAAEAGLPCRSLLGTQIAPEDVSGVPRIVGERSVFCPPRVLLPERPEPFCLFLDELPACAPDVQKAFYSLLLERRLGEHPLPAGSWVVAAGNRAEDRALVRTLSSALVNRVVILNVRVDVMEWLTWAEANGVSPEVRSFIADDPEALLRSVPREPVPFSTPRAWASLSRALDLARAGGVLTSETRRALAFGRVSAVDAHNFCAQLDGVPPDPNLIPDLERKLAMSLAELELSVRATNCLESEGINTVRDLIARTDDELLEVRNFGESTLSEVKSKLDGLGLKLGTKKPFDVDAIRRTVTVTLSQAASLVRCLAHEQSVLLLSPPGVGKSEMVAHTAAAAGLPCRSLLGTQIAPEDVSGVPRIVGERSVFCPPRVLLPERPEPFCLFLDELPACAPDVQKAFYSLLLERRLGEHPLPSGSWVVAAGNRAEDRALVRTLSSALVNRVIMLGVRVDNREWLEWAREHGVRAEVRSFLTAMPDSLMRPVPREPVPFSTPRAWAALSRALDLTEAAGVLTPAVRRALAFGRVSAQDAAVFCAMAEESIPDLLPVVEYVHDPSKLAGLDDTARWFVLSRVRESLTRGDLRPLEGEPIRRFLEALPEEHRCALLIDMVELWASHGAGDVLLKTLAEVTGI